MTGDPVCPACGRGDVIEASSMAGTHLTYFCTAVACGHSWSTGYGDQRIWQPAPWPDEAERERRFNQRVREHLERCERDDR